MTKQEAYDLLGCNRIELAALLKIEPPAISQWDDDSIPQLREYQVKEIAKNRETSQQLAG